MGIVHKIKREKDNFYYYKTNSKIVNDINNKEINKYTIRLLISILKNNDLQTLLEYMVGILNEDFAFPVFEVDTQELSLITISHDNLLYYINYLINNNLLMPKEEKIALNIIRIVDPLYLEKNLDYKILDDVSIKDIIDFFQDNSFWNEDFPFGYDPSIIAGLLELKPFNIKYNSFDKSIFNRLPSYKDRKDKILKNMREFKYRYDTDEIAKMQLPKSQTFNNYTFINDDLKEELFADIPTDFTMTQKLYYIYRRLCQILSYDDKYYLGNQRRTYTIDHNNIKRVKEINAADNIVVCNEIAIILGTVCKELGLPYVILNNEFEAKLYNYGKEHLCVETKVGDYYIKMDPTTGLVNSDLSLEKTRGYVEAFWVKNKTQRTKDFFAAELIKVDKYIESKSKELGYDKFIYHSKLAKKVSGKSFDFRMKLFVKCILDCPLSTMDGLRYFLDLKKTIFSPQYDNCVGLDYRAKEELCAYKVIPNLAVVVIFNEDGLSDDLADNDYVCIMNNEVMELKYDELKKMNLKSVDRYRDADEDEQILVRK